MARGLHCRTWTVQGALEDLRKRLLSQASVGDLGQNLGEERASVLVKVPGIGVDVLLHTTYYMPRLPLLDCYYDAICGKKSA